MVKCPSEFCDHDNPPNAPRCGKCFLDLKLPKDEIEARDKIYKLVLLVLKELEKENPEQYKEFKGYLEKLDVGIFHDCIEKYVGRLFLMIVRAMGKGGTTEETKERDKQEGINLCTTNWRST